MMIFIWALVPPIFVVLLFYLIDPNRKPLKAIGRVLTWSFVAFIPILLLVILKKKVLHIEHWIPTEDATLQLIDKAFLAAAIPEEIGKWLALWLFVKKCGKFFQYPYDGILYGACIGAIFGGLENIYYLNIGFPVAVRLLLSLPGHVMDALIMGYFFALIRFDAPSWRNKVCMMLIPILFHGFWDFFLFLLQNDILGNKEWVLLLLVLILFVFEIVYSVRLIKAHRRRSIS